MGTDKTSRIIYIEDDPEMIELITLILSRHKLEVKGANGGLQGLELVSKELPDLVLLDLMMPDMDGWEVYQQLKAQESTASIPVIIITAKAQDIDRILGLRIAKVDDYVIKPFHAQALVESVQRVLELSASESQN
jgi:two-component system, OmpR family, response regulator VicR